MILKSTTLSVLAIICYLNISSFNIYRGGIQVGLSQKSAYTNIGKGTHPSLLFSNEEIHSLQKKIHGDTFTSNMWSKIVRYSKNWTLDGEWINQGMEMDAKALLYQINNDEEKGREALEMMKKILLEIDPYTYYFDENKTNVFWMDDWPKAFAYAYDWLYPLMSVEERKEISIQLAQWCKALYEHTEQQWWQSASYNVGAIPVGALGLLCLAIQSELKGDPEFKMWLYSVLVRVRDNYFPTTWRQNGICYEGPDYAQYLRNPVLFGEALRRNGGPDILSTSGAINAMNYQRHQWMPGGEECPIGDNTNYGRRVFQAIYLLGIDEMNDEAGLYSFLKWNEPDKINPIFAFILYPDDLKPKSAGELKLVTSEYFEITANRAGYFFGRSEWDNEEAAFFAFVTRYLDANHQHYDMNSFVFSAFGEEFATHANLYPYKDSLHGVDKEHNLVIVDDGGMPGHDAINGAGDDCSINGYMTGVGTGHFADYVRGDAAKSYQDRSLKGSSPAVRANRYGAFVKQGSNPYLIMVDDIQMSPDESHIYTWLWHTNALSLSGGHGTLEDPLIIPGEKANCAIGFMIPRNPQINFSKVIGKNNRHKVKNGRISVQQVDNHAKYFAIAMAWRKDEGLPEFKPGPEVQGSEEAVSLLVEGDDFTDYILWQPDIKKGGSGVNLKNEYMYTNALISIVRTDKIGNVTGYLMGDGTELRFKNKELVKSTQAWTVSADTVRLIATGALRAIQNQPPLIPKGHAWLPDKGTKVYVNGIKINPVIQNETAIIGAGL